MRPDFRHRIEYKEYVETSQFSARITVLAVFWTAVMTAYLLSFYYLQIVKADDFRELAEANRIRHVMVPPPRGAILDRFGRVLARNRPAFEVLLTREKVRDIEATLAELAPVIGVEPAELRRIVTAAASRPAYEPITIGSDVSLAAASYIESRRADLPGITIRTSMKRFYPEGDIGAHELGYVGEITQRMLDTPGFEGMVQGDIVGKAGIERAYNAELQGQRGERLVIVNSSGRVMGELTGGVSPVPGRPVRLTLDLDMQRELEAAFGERVGAAVFLDPRNGRILAMTSRPGFDPNFFARRFNRQVWQRLVRDPRHPLQNRSIQSAYSPGSTFKPVVAGAALEEGLATQATSFFCAGSVVFYGRTFRCHLRSGHGRLAMKDAIKHSCNIYFYNLGSRLGIDAITRYARHLGLGEATGIDIGPENPGLVPSQEWKLKTHHERWYPSETVSVAIGQGPLTVTPLQMAMVQAFIATNGLMVRPHLHRDLSDPDEAGGYEMISRHSLQVIREAEWAVVNDGGTGWRAKIPGRDVCGKTGTAQVFSGSADLPDEEVDENMRDHAWFVGFAPKDDPRIAFAVIVEHAGHGGTAAAPIARRVLVRFFESEDNPPPDAAAPERMADVRETIQSAL